MAFGLALDRDLSPLRWGPKGLCPPHRWGPSCRCGKVVGIVAKCPTAIPGPLGTAEASLTPAPEAEISKVPAAIRPIIGDASEFPRLLRALVDFQYLGRQPRPDRG